MTISIELCGRLGNQLFQYAVLRNIGLIKDYDIYYNNDFIWHEQKCLLNNFNLKKSTKLSNNLNNYFQKQNNNEHVSKGGGCSTFDESIYNIKDNTLLHGHFCNEKYFFENRKIIKNELSVKGEVNDKCEKHINNIYEKYNNCKIVGIHIRRGDNVSQKFFVFEETDNFIKKALNEIQKKEDNIYLIFFTGGSTKKRHNNWIDNTHTNDIDWINNYVKQFSYNYEISFGTHENNELVDYCLLSKCDYNILSELSSFGWMACYINQKNDNKVYTNNNNYKSAEKFIILD